MAYNPTNPVVVGAATKKDHYDRAFDNTVAIYAGAMGLSGQAAGGDIAPSSATQLAHFAAGRQLRQSFRGLHDGTHQDADVAAAKTMVRSCKEAVMHDGTRVADWTNIVTDMGTNGAGGLLTGAEAASTWYRRYLLRKSSDGTKSSGLLQMKDYFLDQQQTTQNSTIALRSAASTNIKIGQTWQPATTGLRDKFAVQLQRTGSPSGRIKLGVYATAAGAPTGAALFYSDNLDASLVATSLQYIAFPCRNPSSLTAGTKYALILEGDYTESGANNISWGRNTGADNYANGEVYTFDGTTWSAGGANNDFVFKDYVTRNDLDIASYLPAGYDQYCEITPVYNDSGSNLWPFVAIDRRVWFYYRSSLGSITATVATLVEAALLPPRPCVVIGTGENDTSGQNIQVQSVPGGLESTRFAWTLTSSTGGAQIPFGDLVTEYQALYLRVSANTGICALRGFIW